MGERVFRAFTELSGAGDHEVLACLTARFHTFDHKTRLSTCCRSRGFEPGALFLVRGARPLTSNAIRMLLQGLAHRAGVEAASHDFQRAFAARMRRSGLDLGHVARLLGHFTLTMTLQCSEEGEGAAIAAYSLDASSLAMSCPGLRRRYEAPYSSARRRRTKGAFPEGARRGLLLDCAHGTQDSSSKCRDL